MLRRPIFGSVLALLAFASTAHADPIAPRLARVLTSPGKTHPLADWTGRVPITVALPPGASAAALGLREVAPGVGAARIDPLDLASFSGAHPGLPISIAPPRKPQIDVSGKWINMKAFHDATGLDGSGVVVGVVDTGLDIRHADFRDKNGKTRVAWMLAGGTPAGLHPDLEERFGCTDPKGSPCAIYAAEDIDAMLAAGTGEPRDLQGHGTHVASIAAGNGGPMATAKPRYLGVAPKATLVIAAPGSAGGFYDGDILNAATFVFAMAEEKLQKPAVLNLSLGGDYGSHDGQSPLEKGLSALVGNDKPGRAIVVAAGNSGSIFEHGSGEGPFGIHTEVRVSQHEVARVPISAGSVQKGQGFVWITFRPGDEVDVALEGPDGARWIGFTGPGDDGAYDDGSGSSSVKAGVVNNLPKANPAISPDTNSAVVVFTGRWTAGTFTILMRGTGDASLWITGTGDAEQGLLFTRAMRQGTINVPASAPSLLAVGCTVNRIAWKPLAGHAIELGEYGDDTAPTPDGACYFSADGPTPLGVQKPEISAPGGFIAAAMSADADPRILPGGLFDLQGCPVGQDHCAVLDDRHALAAGTSMSAPHVAGAIALLMEIDPKLTQARATEVLQAGARRPTGHAPDAQQLGPGVLDLEGARQALLDTMAVPADPDLSKSWYTLSSAFARADPTWPVWGTIELRKLDGSLAGGVDGSKLTLSVNGGATYQTLTKVRQGMWRFAVAGNKGDLGGRIAIDVAYDGVSLGASILPVGTDPWTATDTSLSASSGACASAAGRSGGAGVGALLAAGVAILVARRRRAKPQPAR